MGFHHVAFATNDTAATHDFYTRVMGFELVKVVAAPTPTRTGFAKHMFYATEPLDGGREPGMIAFWEIHDPKVGDGHEVDLNKAAGFPNWVNHIAFDAPTVADLDAHRARWQECGYLVLEIDHGFCRSIYINDPSGNTVEFCCTTRAFTQDELDHATATVLDPAPALDDNEPLATVWEPAGTPAGAPAS